MYIYIAQMYKVFCFLDYIISQKTKNLLHLRYIYIAQMYKVFNFLRYIRYTEQIFFLKKFFEIYKVY